MSSTRAPACLSAPLSDAPLLITHSARLLCVLSAADAIRGWTAAEQEEWIAHPFGPVEFRDCIGAVDATYVRIQRPKRYEDERRLYSTYKKYHAVFFICIIDREGEQGGDMMSRGAHACWHGVTAHHWLCLPVLRVQGAFATWTEGTSRRDAVRWLRSTKRGTSFCAVRCDCSLTSRIIRMIAA